MAFGISCADHLSSSHKACARASSRSRGLKVWQAGLQALQAGRNAVQQREVLVLLVHAVLAGSAIARAQGNKLLCSAHQMLLYKLLGKGDLAMHAKESDTCCATLKAHVWGHRWSERQIMHCML